jgi:two-component system, LytTR family, response regulator
VKNRVLIVDDEPLARLKLRTLLRSDPRIEIIGEAENGRQAVAAIRDKSPDLVFLDVQMPEMGGFEVIRAVGPERMPCVIFTTAYDEYALKAFEVHALDYLLKPFIGRRFREAVDRAVDYLQAVRMGGTLKDRLAELLRESLRDSGVRDRILIKTGETMRLIRIDEIDWIEAAEKYVILHCSAAAHTLREGLTEMEKRLDPRHFLRIHRSRIVHIDSIREIQPWFHGQAVLFLKTGEKIEVSRTYRQKLESLFKK